MIDAARSERKATHATLPSAACAGVGRFTPAHGARGARQAAGWAPAALAARPGENISLRRQRPLAALPPSVAPATYEATLRGVVRRVGLPAGGKPTAPA